MKPGINKQTLVTALGIFILFGLIIFVFDSLYALIESRRLSDKEIVLPINNDDKDTYLQGITAIYWINLDRSEERRLKMERLFLDPVFKNIETIRVSALDGRKPETVFSRISNYRNPKFTDIEYACLLSHLEAIRAFAESKEPGREVAMIMEDDASLDYKPYWREPVDTIISNAPPDWEVIQLSIISLVTQHPIYTTDKFYSCLSYIIRRKAAREFIKKVYNSETRQYSLLPSVRHISDHYIYEELKTYTYKYPLFTYPMKNDSTIHSEDLDYHVKSKKLYDKLMTEDKS